MLPCRERLLHPRLDTLLPHDIHIAQPSFTIQSRQKLQGLYRMSLEELVRLRGDVRECDQLPPSPRQVRQRAGELNAKQWTLPGVVEDLA